MLSKFIQFVKEHQADIILVIGVILISLLSFAIGYIVAKGQEKEPIRIENHESSYHRSRYFWTISGLEALGQGLPGNYI